MSLVSRDTWSNEQSIHNNHTTCLFPVGKSPNHVLDNSLSLVPFSKAMVLGFQTGIQTQIHKTTWLQGASSKSIGKPKDATLTTPYIVACKQYNLHANFIAQNMSRRIHS